MAFGTLSSAISNAAGKGLGFDVFQIRQEPTRGLTLTAGRYVSSRLFLDLQLPLQVGSQGQQVPGSNLGPGFELEYRSSVGFARAFGAGASRRASCSRRAVRTERRAWAVLGAFAGDLWRSPRRSRRQDALNRVGPKTQVRSVEFHFDGTSSLDEAQLRDKIALTGQGSMVGLRRLFRFIPLRAAGRRRIRSTRPRWRGTRSASSATTSARAFPGPTWSTRPSTAPSPTPYR